MSGFRSRSLCMETSPMRFLQRKRLDSNEE
jgi:hypothetical protein